MARERKLRLEEIRDGTFTLTNPPGELTGEEIAGFHRRTYSPQGMVIAVTGPVAPEAARDKVQATLGGWAAPHGTPNRTIPERVRLDEATATILLDATGDRIVLWHRDPALCYPPDRLPAGVIAASRVLHVDDVDVPAAIEAARIARAHGIPVTCDIDHVTPGTRDLLQLVSHPVFAESVPAQLTGEPEPERALRALRRVHPGPLVVTVGEKGAIALEGDTLLAAPGFPVTVVDSTGAGDVFRGGYIFGIVRGWSLERQLWFANAAAAVSCTKAGAMGGVPALAEVEALLALRS